jgi:hypothetical protein
MPKWNSRYPNESVYEIEIQIFKFWNKNCIVVFFIFIFKSWELIRSFEWTPPCPSEIQNILMKWYIYDPWDAIFLESNNIVGVLKIMVENLGGGCLHATVALYGFHNGKISCIPLVQENK